MHSFTKNIFNKAHIFRLQRTLIFAIGLIFLAASLKIQAQCPPPASGPVAIATPSSATFCSGSITSIALTSGSGGTTFSWTAFQTDVLGATDGSGTAIVDTLTALEVTPGTVAYTITPDSAGCLGLPIVVNVTVDPVPVANQPANQTICSGGTTSIALSADVALTSFTWVVFSQSAVSGASAGSGTSIAQILNTTGPSAGIATYQISPMASSCRGDSIKVKVTVRQLPTINLVSDSLLVCQGTTVANLFYNTPGGAPNQYSIDYDPIANGQGFVDITPPVALPASPIVLVVPGGAAPGVYNAVLSVNKAACPGASYPISITILAPPTVAIAGPDQTPPCGLNSVTLAGNVAVIGTGIWTEVSGDGLGIFADPTDPNSLFTGTAGVTYVLAWTISNPPCPPSTDNVTIIFNQNPTTAAAGPDQNLCAGPATLAGNTPLIGIGSWSIFSGAGGSFVDSSDPTTVFNGIAGTTYVLIWTITNVPCPPSTDSVTIAFNQTPTPANAGPDQALCATSTTLAANTPITGIGSWIIFSGAGGSLLDLSDPATTFSGTAGTSYVLIWTITSPFCPTSTDSVTITFNSTPTLITVPQSICSPATTVDLTLPGVTAGSTPGLIFTYFTDLGATIPIPDPTAVTAGTYYIVGTLGSACADTAAVTVTVNPSPTVVTNDQWVCSPATVDLTSLPITLGSTGGLIFSYYTDALATIPYLTPTVATNGTYYIVGVTAFGCSDTTSVNITVGLTPTVITVPQFACSPATVNLTLPGVTAGSTPGLSFTYWTDAAATIPYLTPVVATSGTYYIVGTNGSCADTTPVTVIISPKPTLVTNNPATVCAPSTVDLTLAAVTAGSTPGLLFTYFTDSTATTPYGTPAAATAGIYYIVGTTLAGCSDTAAVTVTITPKPVVNTVPQTACAPATVNLTLGGVTAGSTPGLIFTYFTDAAATVPYPTPTTATTGTYYIVGTTAGGCADTTAVTVLINPSPTVVTNDPAAGCSPETADLTALAVTAGSTPGLVFTYFLDAGATIPYLTPTVAPGGTYYIMGTNGFGCSDITAVTVTINPTPSVVTAPLSLCIDASVDLTDPAVTFGSSPGLIFTYFTDSLATIPVPDPTAVPVGTYYIVGTNIFGCSDTASVTVSPLPIVVTTDQEACSPATTTDLTLLAVTAGSTPGLIFTYYTDSTATVSVPDPTAVTAGTYYIVGTTVDGCADTTAVIFSINSKPTVLTVPQSACAPATVNLTLPAVTAGSTPGLSFTYFTNIGATIPYPTPGSAGAGTYYIVGTTAFGCTDTTSVLVTIDGQPTVITANQSVCLPILTVDLTLPAVTAGSTPGLIFTYFTDPGATIPVADPTAVTAGTYYIVGTIPGGCSKTNAVTVAINTKPTVVTTPQSTCAPATINITLPAVTAGSTLGLIYTYFTDATALIPVPLPAAISISGTYYIVGSTGAGCSDTTSVLVTINPKPDLVTVSQSVCAPATTADLTLPSVTAGSSLDLTPPFVPFTYYTDPGATSPYGTPTAATAGTYYIVGVTAAGCRDTTAVTFTASPRPTLNTVPQALCRPDTTFDLTQPSATAGSTPGLTFNYYSDVAATIIYPDSTAAIAGTYWIVGTAASGCSDTTAITITVNTKPTVITNDPPPVCSPSTVDITLPAVTIGSTGGLSFTYFTDAGATIPYLTPAAAVGGIYYIVGVTIAGCSDTTAVNVTVNLNPTIANAGLDQTASCVASSATLAGNIALIGTGNWSVFSGAGGSFVDAADPTTVFNGVIGTTYVLIWTISNDPCTATTDSVTITLIQAPTTADAGPDQSVCGLTSATLAANAATSGTGSWSIFSGAGGSFVDASDSTTIFNGTAGTTYILIWTISNPPCTATTDSVTITFNQLPTIATAGPDQTTCGLTAATLAGNAPVIGTGSWSIFSGVGGSFVLATNPTTVFNGVAGNTYVLVWTISNAPCIASTDSVTITFKQAPTIAAAGPDQAICGLTTATLAGNTPVIGTGSWSIFSGVGGSFVLATNPTTVFNGLAGISYVLVWTISNAPCTASTDSVRITFNLAPTVATAGPDQTGAATCGLTSVTLAGNTPVTGTGSWSVFSGVGGSFVLATNPTTVFNGVAGISYVLVWTISNAPCPASTDSVTIKFNLPPTIAAAGPDQLSCGLTSATLAGNVPVTGTGVWTVFTGVGGSFVLATNPTTIFNGVAGNTYVLVWTISNAPCTASTDSVTITFNQAPTIAAAGPDQIGAATCGLTSVTLAGNVPVTGTGSWTVFSGAGGSFVLATNPTTVFNGTAGTTYVLVWTISNAPCTASTDSVTIKFNQAPTVAAAGPDQLSCGLTSATLAANAPVIGTGSWSIFSGVGGSFVLATNPTTVFNGILGNTYVLVWTISNAPCPNSTDSVTIKFSQPPTVATAGPDQTGAATCGFTSATLAANAPVIGTGSWSIFSGGGGSFVLATDPATVFNGTAGTTYVLVWTISNAPCTASTDSVTITFNQAPTIAAAGPDQTSCGLTSATLAANTPTIGIGTWSVFSGAGGSFVLATNPTTVFNGTAGVTYVLRWTINNICGTSTDDVTIIFNLPDDASFSYPLLTYCASDPINPTPTITGLAGGTFSSTPGLVFVSTATGQINLALSAIGTDTVTYTTNGPCPDSATFIVTITNGFSATFSYDSVAYCQGGIPNPFPTFPPGSSAGIFSAIPVGLVFVSTATGQIDLGLSTPGIYTVTDSIPASGGCIAAVASSIVTITALPVATFTYVDTSYCQNAANPFPTFSGGGIAGTFSSTPGLTFVSTATGQVNLALTPPGTYTVTNTISASGGCAAVAATFDITITALPIATFSYAGTPYCQNAANPFPTFPPGASSGIFSAAPAGLVFVSTVTGQVDLAASTPGIYTVTDSIPAFGGCPAVVATTPITINVVDSAAFSYSLSTYCKTGANPTAIITGLPGGTFTALPAGLVFLNATTGLIDLAASAENTYTITYTTNGPCPNTATFGLTITSTPNATFSYASPSFCQGVGLNPSPIFLPGASAGIFTALPAGLVFIDSTTGQIDITASAAGVYSVTNFIAASGGCPANSFTLPVTINAIDDASFSYPLSTYCPSGINPTAVITGLAGGTFTALPAGLVFINNNIGLIDLAASALATYTITYTTNGSCPNTATFNLTITATPDATFSYAGPYCQGGNPNPSPIFLPGASAGVFSAIPAGLVFVNANTGQIDITASATGTYIVKNVIAAAGGCPADSSINTVTINGPPTVAAAGPDQISAATCGLTSVTLAGNSPIVGTGNWSIASGGVGAFADPTDSATVFSGVAGATYVLVWTISNNPCTASTDSVTITFNQAPTIAAAGPDQTSAATCGLTSVTLAANNATIGTGNWSIFSGAGGSFVDATDSTTVFSGTTGTTYVLIWTITNICGSTTDSVTIKFNQNPTTADAGPDQTGSSTCGLLSVTLAGNSAIIGTGNWSIFSGGGGSFVDATDSATVFNGASDSTYVLIWTITNAPCVSTDSMTITFNPIPTVVTNAPAAVCSPATVDLTLPAVTATSTAGLTFTYFTDANATIHIADSTAVATSGTYYIVGVTAAGCSDTTAVVVTVHQSPAVTATKTDLACFNVCTGTAIATVIGGSPLYNYVWSSGVSDTTALTTDTITGLCAIGYTVTVTDANGCIGIDSVDITQPAQISANITTTNVSCNGVCDGASLSVPSGGTIPYTFAWSTGSVDSAIVGLCPGTYTVIVTDSLACSVTIADTILPATPILSNAAISNATCGLCDGQVTLSPSGGITPYTFLWGNGQTGTIASDLCAGLYSVNITDSAGCSASFSIPISNPGGPTGIFMTSTDISCNSQCNGTVIIDSVQGGTTPYSYLWIPSGLTTGTLNNLCAGVYYVEVADSNGCALIDSATITQPSPMLANQFVTAVTACGVCDGSISIVPSGGTGPYNVLWSNDSTTYSIGSLCPGFYSVQITDSLLCSQNIVIPLNGPNGPSLTTSSTALLCNDSCNATASVIAIGGILPYSYLWNDPVPQQTTATATALCAGTYFVQVTDSASCVSFASVVITNPAPIGFAFANIIDPLCYGGTNGSITVIPAGGILPYTFSWSPNISTVTDTALNLSAGVYTVTIADANGCPSTQTNTLVNPDSLTILHVVTPATCNTTPNGAIDLTVGGGTPGYTYQWSGGSVLTTQDLTNILIGAYTVIVSDTNGCTISDAITVTSTTTVIADAGNDTTFCQPGGMILNAEGSSDNVINYQWFQIQVPTDSLVGSVVDVPVTPQVGTTSYYVIVDTIGCSNSDTVIVTVNPLPVADAGQDITILGNTGTIIGGNPTGPPGSTYIWNPSIALDNATNANPFASPITTTSYTVTVTSSQGCVSSDIIIVTVVANITFPNGISPNGDGANDEWIIDNIELFPNSLVEVYNRWGELLFQSKGYVEKWKGIYKGQPLPIGTYYYIINLNDPLFPDALTGPITVLR